MCGHSTTVHILWKEPGTEGVWMESTFPAICLHPHNYLMSSGCIMHDSYRRIYCHTKKDGWVDWSYIVVN